jgi:S-adenosylmethionine-diacylglycerol 3-amino-3-carboxypropyl transferase
VEGSVADRILARARHALSELDPSDNPYLHWIFYGHHSDALPHALRPENYQVIRANLERFEWRAQSLEEFLDSEDARDMNAYNLSDIFEYMSPENYHRILNRIVDTAADGARLAYWNLLVSRRRPATMASQLRPLSIAADLHQRDKTFFYDAFVVEEVTR